MRGSETTNVGLKNSEVDGSTPSLTTTKSPVLPQGISYFRARHAGITNVGLFATHNLTAEIRSEPESAAATDAARPWLKLRGESLIASMGYTVKTSTAKAHILTPTGHNQPRAVAVLLREPVTQPTTTPGDSVTGTTSSSQRPWRPPNEISVGRTVSPA